MAADREDNMMFKCRLVGRINVQSGAVRRVNRSFDGYGDVRSKALAELARRRDGGSPWCGDAVTVISPLGERIDVDVPWPEGE